MLGFLPFLLWYFLCVPVSTPFMDLVDPSIPGALEFYSTRHSIGFEWNLTGDSNHNANCSIRFKKTSAQVWLDGMPLYRVDFQAYNMFAGSLFFLEPGSQYDIELNFVDPDGGDSLITFTIQTNTIPSHSVVQGQTYHVIPGSGGGTGSEVDPFRGVEAAEAVANPGDVFLLHAGNYGGVIYFTTGGTVDNPIIWRAAHEEVPVFEGIRLEANYLWLDGLTIIDQQYGLRTSPPGPVDIVITHCKFLNNHNAIYLNDGGSGWYIADNLIIGDNDPNVSNFSGEGIELNHTSHHTIAYNTISRVGDGISYPHKNVDMFNNEIFDTSDDGIEFDYGHANNRAWQNRITNTLNNGISFQPMDGAPYYVLFNQVSALNESVLKLRTRSDRALIAHNTFVSKSGPVGYGAHLLESFEIKNNLWISVEDRYAWENGVQATTSWKTDFDYDGFDWGNYPYAFKWGSSNRLEDIQQFYILTGQELHGIHIDHTTCMDSIAYAQVGGVVDSFYHRYYSLTPSCNAIDAGIPLPNINEEMMGAAPDLGAYEFGKSLPHYGIRATCSTISTNKWIGPTTGHWHENIAYWSANRFPGPCDHVLIEAGYTITIQSGQIGIAYSLELEKNAQLETLNAGQLEVSKRE